jgi:hypothetical protein
MGNMAETLHAYQRASPNCFIDITNHKLLIESSLYARYNDLS